MARPEQNGCQYFPLDCNFFEDRKVRLLRSEFGAKAESVLIRLWCMIYADKGWYACIDDDEIALLSESMGPGFGADYIREVILGSCKRGIFDDTVFTQFGVLTSASVQKRYLAIKTKKKSIPVISEYWLLDETFFQGENEPLLLKLHFFNVNAEKTAVITEETPVNTELTPQSKEKKSKRKKSKNNAAKAAAPAAKMEDECENIFHAFAGDDVALLNDLLAFHQSRAETKKPMTTLACSRLCSRLDDLTTQAHVHNRSGYMRAMLDKAILNGWQGVFAVDDFRDSAPVHSDGGADRPRMITADTDINDLL